MGCGDELALGEDDLARECRPGMRQGHVVAALAFKEQPVAEPGGEAWRPSAGGDHEPVEADPPAVRRGDPSVREAHSLPRHHLDAADDEIRAQADRRCAWGRRSGTIAGSVRHGWTIGPRAGSSARAASPDISSASTPWWRFRSPHRPVALEGSCGLVNGERTDLVELAFQPQTGKERLEIR